MIGRRGRSRATADAVRPVNVGTRIAFAESASAMSQAAFLSAEEQVKSVRAEAVALGRAVTETGNGGIDTIVAVRHPKPHESDRAIAVVSPCGACRELIWDYDRRARVIVPGAAGPAIVAIGELLPNKYSRERTL